MFVSHSISISFDQVKSHIQTYLKNLVENLLDREDRTELYLLFVNCFQVKDKLHLSICAFCLNTIFRVMIIIIFFPLILVLISTCCFWHAFPRDLFFYAGSSAKTFMSSVECRHFLLIMHFLFFSGLSVVLRSERGGTEWRTAKARRNCTPEQDRQETDSRQTRRPSRVPAQHSQAENMP